MELRVGYINSGTRALGPGMRFVIWTQGCKRNCAGCVSPDFRPLTDGYTIDTNNLVNQICNCIHIDGITISGGEPFLQSEALLELLTNISSKRPELDVIVFTGNVLEELCDKNSVALLNHIDLLVDGEYKSDLYCNVGLRGSSNQRFHYLTPRLKSFADEIENGTRRQECHWVDEERKAMEKIGIPTHE